MFALLIGGVVAWHASRSESTPQWVTLAGWAVDQDTALALQGSDGMFRLVSFDSSSETGTWSLPGQLQGPSQNGLVVRGTEVWMRLLDFPDDRAVLELDTGDFNWVRGVGRNSDVVAATRLRDVALQDAFITVTGQTDSHADITRVDAETHMQLWTARLRSYSAMAGPLWYFPGWLILGGGGSLAVVREATGSVYFETQTGGPSCASADRVVYVTNEGVSLLSLGDTDPVPTVLSERPVGYLGCAIGEQVAMIASWAENEDGIPNYVLSGWRLADGAKLWEFARLGGLSVNGPGSIVWQLRPDTSSFAAPLTQYVPIAFSDDIGAELIVLDTRTGTSDVVRSDASPAYFIAFSAQGEHQVVLTEPTRFLSIDGATGDLTSCVEIISTSLAPHPDHFSAEVWWVFQEDRAVRVNRQNPVSEPSIARSCE